MHGKSFLTGDVMIFGYTVGGVYVCVCEREREKVSSVIILDKRYSWLWYEIGDYGTSGYNGVGCVCVCVNEREKEKPLMGDHQYFLAS